MNIKKSTLVMLAAFTTMAFGAVSHAQDDAAAAAPAPAEVEGTGSIESDLDLYWGGKRDVSVVQKRLFTKDGKIEVTAFGGVVPNDPFVTYFPVGGRVNYYFLESISVEVAGSYMGLNSNSDLDDFLKENVNATVHLLDQQQWRANAAVVWSPFYGKMALLQRKLSHFDINIAAGAGALGVESPDPDDRSQLESAIKVEGILGGGFRFFVSDALTVRLDYRQGIFEKVGGGAAMPSELTLGASYFFGG